MLLSRRGFLTGIIAACAAPAIMRAGLIMPIKPTVIVPTDEEIISITTPSLYETLSDITRRPLFPRMFVDLYFETPTLKHLLREGK